MFHPTLEESRTTVGFLLTCSSKMQPPQDADVYDVVWKTKGLATQWLKARHTAALIGLRNSPKLQKKWDDFVVLQQQIANLILSPPSLQFGPLEGMADTSRLNRDKHLLELFKRRDQLERELTPLLPELSRTQEWGCWRHPDLQKHLPARTVFIDFLRYFNFDPIIRKWQYVAFVVAPGQPVRRVELGEADSLDTLCNQWRKSITEKEEVLPDQIHRRVWANLAQHFPEGTRSVYLSPDGNLARIPWSALPGACEGSVLLEDFDGGIATVPNGIWLLDQLKYPPAFSKGEDSALLVGNVYNISGGKRDVLPGSEYVLNRIRTLAEQGGVNQRRVIPLTVDQPTRERLRQELPSCRYFNFAWHGFFDEESLQEERRRAAEAVRNWPRSMQGGWQPAGLGARNPLSFT